MHQQVIDFLKYVKQNFNSDLINKRVLDVGSGDINGNNRYLFENCEYNGNDVTDAPNVTIVSRTKNLPFENESFDTIISTECFEHDPEYKESLLKIYDMLKKDGLFIFTCASYGRPEHGTRRTSPNCSYGTISNNEDMSDYYKNLVKKDIEELFNLNEKFTKYKMYYNNEIKDLYFVGRKKGLNDDNDYPVYDGYQVIDITYNDVNYEELNNNNIENNNNNIENNNIENNGTLKKQSVRKKNKINKLKIAKQKQRRRNRVNRTPKTQKWRKNVRK